MASVGSGAERVLYEQSVRLARKGYGVVVLTRFLPSHDAMYEAIDGVHEFRYAVQSKNPVAFLYSTILNGRRVFNMLQRCFRFDCIHFHQPFSAIAVLLSPLAAGIRKIYTCHSLAHEEYISRNTPLGGQPMSVIRMINIFCRKWMEKYSLTHSNQIVTLSQYTREKLLSTHGIPAEKVNVVFGGVDLSRFYPSADKAAIRKRLDIPDDQIILLTVRNLDARMGIENLINALSIVIKAVPNIFLVIGGSGPLLEKLKELTRRLGLDPFIHFTGFIPEDQLSEYYRMADLFILPTTELEGFGLVTLESLASGVPVLGTSIGGTREILSALDPEFLFADITQDAMAALIEKKCRIIIENPSKWAETSHQCRRFVETHYSWDTNLNALEALMTL